MGRDYKRFTKRHNGAYDEAALEEALNSLQHGESYRSVDREYGAPKRTLQRHDQFQVKWRRFTVKFNKIIFNARRITSVKTIILILCRLI